MSLMINDIKIDLGIGDFHIGLLYGLAFALFHTIGTLPFGWAIDRFNRPRIIYLGVAIWSIATMAHAFARNFTMFFAARALVGAGEAALTPGSQSLIASTFPRHRLALPMAIYSLGFKVGAGVSMLLGGVLLTLISPGADYFLPLFGSIRGWQLVFLLGGAPGLLVGLIVFLVPERRERRAAAVTSDDAGYGAYWRFARRHLRFLLPHHLALLPLAMVMFSVQVWSPAFLSRVHGWTPQHIGYSLGLTFTVATLISLPIHGLIVDRLFHRGMKDAHLRYMMAALLIGTPVGIAGYFAPTPELTVLLLGLFLVIVGGYATLPATALQIVVPEPFRGKAASVMAALVGVFSAGLGPMVVGFLTDRVFGDPSLVGCSISLCMFVGLPLSALIYVVTLKPMRLIISK